MALKYSVLAPVSEHRQMVIRCGAAMHNIT